MGALTTGIGLISGIDTASLIDALITLQSGPKLQLQTRLAVLQSRQTALMDINARLLNLKSSSAGLRSNNVFQSALATSSDSNILTAAATGSVQPGTYSFLVKQIVSNSQRVSRGFTDSDTTPVGLTSLSFELGNGKLSTNTDLGDLNAATGVARGKIVITDGDGDTTVDLSTATTINEVLDAINSSGADVTASAEGDHLVVTENTADALTIADATGYTTASDLGIAGTDGGGTITGTDIRTLGGLTPLSSLNDGTGVYFDDGSYDFKITTRNGREFDIDLGRIDNPITGATLIEDLNNGAGVTLNSDSTEDIQFVDRDGVEHDVDLTGIVTVQELIDRVNDQTDGAITITVHADEDKFTVTDNTGGTGLLKVLGAGPNETDTAEDLGILEATGVGAASFDGDILANADHTPAAKTIQDVIDRINNAKDTVDVDNGGHIVASIAADGVSLFLEDTVGGGPAANFTVVGSPTNDYAARDLGIETLVGTGSTIDGNRLIAGINSVLVRSLNGGAGIGGDSSLIIQDRTGSGDLLTIDPDSSVSDIIDQINASALVDVTASLNDAGNGLLVTDNTGSTISNLIVTGDVYRSRPVPDHRRGRQPGHDQRQLQPRERLRPHRAHQRPGGRLRRGRDRPGQRQRRRDPARQRPRHGPDQGRDHQRHNRVGSQPRRAGDCRRRTDRRVLRDDDRDQRQRHDRRDHRGGQRGRHTGVRLDDQHRVGGHAHQDDLQLRGRGHPRGPRGRRRGVRPEPDDAVRGPGLEGVLRLRGSGAGNPHQAVVQHAGQRRAGRQHRPPLGERHAGHPHRQP
jgi:flagellar hook-associated protein 2